MDANELAAYIERRLEPSARQRLEAHLADCAECRADAVAALHARPRAVVPWRTAVPLLAAAVLAIIVVPRIWRAPVVPDTERGAPVAVAVELAAPVPDATLAPGDVSFAWRSLAPAAEYLVTVTALDGRRVAERRTQDTVLVVAADSLPPARYRWLVDAVLPDGTVRSSPSRTFTIRP